MSITSFLLMRHELLLTLAMLIILIAEIFTSQNSKKQLIPFSIILLGVVTALGFIPVGEGTLFGGMYQTDALRVFMKNIINIGLFIIFLQSSEWLQKSHNSERIPEFFILTLASTIGMNLMISAGDFLLMYLGIEMATIPSALMAAYERHKNQSAEAGMKLILTSALSSGILLFGLSMIYGVTGSIYFDDVQKEFLLHANFSLPALGLVFFISGMAFKISLVPFHLWTADVYEGAPVSVTAFLSVLSKGAAVFVLMWVLWQVFGQVEYLWSKMIFAISALTMTVGNLFAIRQNNMKRFLAFSSIAQAGFILLGIMAPSATSMATIVFFLMIYIFTNLAAFGVVGIIANKTGLENISDYKGLYHTNPKLSLTLMLSMFSLAGIPPVAGFFGKFFLFSAVSSAGFYSLLIVAVLNAAISLYYYLLPVKAMFIDKNKTPIAAIKTNRFDALAIGICVVALITIGFASALFEYIVSISI
ncbi:MAG: NADH-quinone oxidoreductase subunit N [Breznakibacter sp.]|nr:NADH-quinone oxidoreductase subunit N [Breznakibacter sp.]